jgi:AhpD family alkylhydroperoxidase
MARLDPAAHAAAELVYADFLSKNGKVYAVGSEINDADRIYAHVPEIARAYKEFGAACRRSGLLPFRLVELVRLRVAFHNQCKLCMSVRYADPELQRALDEDLVCTLAKPADAPDLTDAERSALAYADRMATNHLSIDDAIFDDLKKHFTTPQIVELCFRVASNVGFGRMASVLDAVPQEDLPAELRGRGIVAPWATAVS